MHLRTPRPVLSFVLASTLLVACTVESSSVPAAATPPAAESTVAAPAPTAAAHVHELACGCVLDAVGHCAEYIRDDGEFVELVPPVDLGSMPFCGKDGLSARVDGELKDGKFVASTFAYVE